MVGLKGLSRDDRAGAGKINLTEATEIIAVVDPGREVAGEQYFR